MTVDSSSTANRGGRVLIVGASGFIGQFLAEASLETGRPTYVLVRPTTTGNKKVAKILENTGAILLHVRIA